jgi:hypothetical protein
MNLADDDDGVSFGLNGDEVESSPAPARRQKSTEPFIMIPKWLIESPSYRQTSPADRAVYVELFATYDGTNNGRLFRSVRDLSDRCNIHKDTAAKAYTNLAAAGLIENTRPPRLAQRGRMAAEWRLTHLPCNLTGRPPSLTPTRLRAPARRSRPSGGELRAAA